MRPLRLVESAIITASFAFAASACSGGGSGALSANAPPRAPFVRNISIAHAPKGGRAYELTEGRPWRSPGRIWASAFANDPSGSGFVNYYRLRGKDQPPLGQLSGALDGPEGMATDANGTLYVANTIDGNVLVYAPGATSPTKTLTDLKGWVPGELAIGADGTLYVTNIHGPLPKKCGTFCIPKPGNIAVYARGSDKPTAVYKTWPATQAYYPIGIGLDSKGDIFASYETSAVSGENASVIEFAAGAKTPTETGIVLGYAGGITFDAKGHMLVGDLTCPCIDVFRRGSNIPSRQIVKTGTPVTFTFDSSGRDLYVANGANLDLEEYDYATDALINSIEGGGFTETTQPTGIAIWPSLNAPK